MKSDAEASVAVIGCVGLIPAAIIGYMLKAWAIVTLWGWFVYPTWHIAVPSNKAAIGLAVLLGALSSHGSASDSDEDDSVYAILARGYASILLSPILSVTIGWCVKEWMR